MLHRIINLPPVADVMGRRTFYQNGKRTVALTNRLRLGILRLPGTAGLPSIKLWSTTPRSAAHRNFWPWPTRLREDSAHVRAFSFPERKATWTGSAPAAL